MRVLSHVIGIYLFVASAKLMAQTVTSPQHKSFSGNLAQFVVDVFKRGVIRGDKSFIDCTRLVESGKCNSFESELRRIGQITNLHEPIFDVQLSERIYNTLSLGAARELAGRYGLVYERDEGSRYLSVGERIDAQRNILSITCESGRNPAVQVFACRIEKTETLIP